MRSRGSSCVPASPSSAIACIALPSVIIYLVAATATPVVRWRTMLALPIAVRPDDARSLFTRASSRPPDRAFATASLRRIPSCASRDAIRSSSSRQSKSSVMRSTRKTGPAHASLTCPAPSCCSPTAGSTLRHGLAVRLVHLTAVASDFEAERGQVTSTRPMAPAFSVSSSGTITLLHVLHTTGPRSME